MSPLREIRPWTSRFKDDVKIDYLKRFYLIFEGTRTEVKYFEGLDNSKRFVGINNAIELVILEKFGDEEGFSHPKKLLELANLKKDELKKDDNYDEEIDLFVIVFDRDSFKNSEEYFEFVGEASKENILGITNPCFEIWLLLHYSNSIDIYIRPNERDILENQKVSNKHTFTSDLFSKVSGMNPKSNLNFEKLKDKIDIAIQQEKSLLQGVEDIANKIGSNIGLFIETMRKDPRDILF
jgi:hypothetical protein